jgi:hypothetical protein
VVAILWLVFQHRPGWYRPATADDATIQRAQAESAEVVDTTSRRIVERRDFELQLTDRMVNEWLAAMPVLWPEARDWWPSGVRDPAVGFDEDEMRIGVFVERDGWRVIANASLAAVVSQDLSTIRITLRSVRGGSLPMPQRVMDSLWGRVLSAVGRGRIDGVELAPVGAKRAGSTHELSIRNHFIWPNGERPFRITRLGAKRGVLTIGMEPL